MLFLRKLFGSMRSAPHGRLSDEGGGMGLPHLLIAIFCAIGLGWLMARWVFGFSYGLGGVLFDAVLWIPLLLLLRPALRGGKAALLIVAVAVLLLGLGHAARLSMLGAPLRVGDVSAATMLLRILSGWQLLFAWTLLLACLAFLAWVIRPRLRGLPWVVLAAIYLATISFFTPQLVQVNERISARGSAGEAAKLSRQGAVLYLLQDWYKYRENLRQQVDYEVLVELAGDEKWQPPRPHSSRRNVHIILLESVWDAEALSGYEFSRHPFDPRFLALWEKAGRPTVLVPTFGGLTANAEFEALCGLQANLSLATFAETLLNVAPCLPRLLRLDGYETIASHPNAADFWSRDRAYEHAGFERYMASDAFELDDHDGPFLSDQSLFRQNLEKLAFREDKKRPLLNYVVTLSSHYAYPRDRARRPDVVGVKPEVAVVRDYVNSVAYTTAAFMDWTEAVLAADPDALIVAFGDHAPVLDSPGVDVYAAAGLRAGAHADTQTIASVYRRLASTPLLVIDGQQGAIAVDTDSLYRLPYRILRWIERDDLRLPQGVALENALGTVKLRGFFGWLLAEAGDGWVLCPVQPPGSAGNDKACERANEAHSRQRQVRADLIRGQQHLLSIMDGHPMMEKTQMQIEAPFAGCGVEALDWGPKSVVAGMPFNQQPDGSSGLWIKLNGARAPLVLELNGVRKDLFVAGGVGSVLFAHDDLGLEAGHTYPVRLYCMGEMVSEIGRLEAHGADKQGLDAQSIPQQAATQVASCNARIKAYGPASIEVGRQFNVQPDGRSAIWLKLDGDSGPFVLRVQGKDVSAQISGDLVSFLYDPAEAVEPVLPIELRCGGSEIARIEIPVRKAI